MTFSGEALTLGDGTTVAGSKVQNYLHLTVPISASSTNQTVFIAPAAYKIVKVQEVHGVVGGTGAAVSLEVIPSGTANGSGTAVGGSSLSLLSTVNTIQGATLTTGTNVPLGSRVGLVFAGTLTGLANGFVQILLTRV